LEFCPPPRHIFDLIEIETNYTYFPMHVLHPPDAILDHDSVPPVALQNYWKRADSEFENDLLEGGFQSLECCALNTIIQCLVRLAPFTTFFSTYKIDKNDDHAKIAKAFQHVIKIMCAKEHRTEGAHCELRLRRFYPKELREVMGQCSNIQGLLAFKQVDVHEVLERLLDALLHSASDVPPSLEIVDWENEAAAQKTTTTGWGSYFSRYEKCYRGHVAKLLHCHLLHTTAAGKSYFTSASHIPVFVGKDANDTEEISFEDLLREAWTTTTPTTTIARNNAPEVLIFFVQRMRYDFTVSKVGISYPVELNMTGLSERFDGTDTDESLTYSYQSSIHQGGKDKDSHFTATTRKSYGTHNKKMLLTFDDERQGGAKLEPSESHRKSVVVLIYRRVKDATQ
jgi:Ubiquitin carboxyl-terminal hydrolase